MKSKIKYIVIFIVAFLVILSVYSYASTLKISNFEYNVIVNEDGSAHIDQKITFETDNNYAWISWPIYVKNAKNRDIPGLKMKMLGVTVDGEKSYCINTGGGQEEGKDHKYEYTQDSDTLGWVKMYTVYNEKPRTVGYEFSVENAVLKNTDVAELYLCPIWNGWDNVTEKLTINVTLPSNAVNGDILVYAHGPNNSSGCYEVDGNQVKIEVNDIGYYRDVYSRILFSSDALNDTVQSTNVEAMERYETEEKADTTYAYPEKTAAENKSGIFFFLGILGTAAVLLAIKIFSRKISF